MTCFLHYLMVCWSLVVLSSILELVIITSHLFAALGSDDSISDIIGWSADEEQFVVHYSEPVWGSTLYCEAGERLVPVLPLPGMMMCILKAFLLPRSLVPHEEVIIVFRFVNLCGGLLHYSNLNDGWGKSVLKLRESQGFLRPIEIVLLHLYWSLGVHIKDIYQTVFINVK